MKPVRPILWHQGLFLQPQHFQQFDIYFQSLLSPLKTYQQPYFWGVCWLRIEETRLRDQVFEVSQGEFIFQDGTWAALPGNTVLQPRTLDKEGLSPGKSFKVYLGLRQWDGKGANATVLQKLENMDSVETRFVCQADPEEVRDLHQGGPAAHVKMMSYLLKIFWEEETEKLDNYFLLPVAELVYEGDEIKVQRNFIPPTVTISSSEILQQIIHNIREQVASRCRKLEDYKSPRGIQTSEVEPGYLLFMMALRSLNKYVPLLYHFTEAPEIHPWVVYTLLRQIIGELSTYTDRIDSLGQLKDGTALLPGYNHDNLISCFDEAQTLIGELLGVLNIGPESIIHLEQENGFFKAQIPQEVFNIRNVFYLFLRTAESKETVLEIMQHIAKVSSVEYMSTLIGRSLPGIRLEHCPIPPPGVPTQPNSFYFEIDQKHEQWVEIQKSQSICLYWDKAPKDMKAQIIVLRR
ncbi:MAG TPA: type VI secretion system baseplate subunit TssK [archaeon]|nr:type VI secretion system baseplate subunit TssK [archaeon]